ncbi:MAG: shikimate dehydrogenase [Actinomycetota bacterium]|jgi:shikimate dehydrogenase|nr:shikimate dehydrogenase [Actinomycetota bacterium]
MTIRVNGTTRLAGIIGLPIDHTLSPAMHNAVYEHLGLNWVYVPLPIADETDLYRLLGAIRALPFVGFNVTMPYKQAMLSLCDEVAMLARMAGAVNTVHFEGGRLIGYNTDGRGLLESLTLETGFDLLGKDVVIVGAGGAAGAAFVAFMLGKARRITVVNRKLVRADELVSRMRSHLRITEAATVETESAEAVIASASLIVNATPLGMRDGDVSPIPAEWLNSEQVVVDMIYRPSKTALEIAAEQAGAKAINGLGMLVSQGALAVDIWSESAQIRTPRDVMRAAAERAMIDMHTKEIDF